ncbi:bacteriochlorophyllide d C-20 methyltransferase BchU [Candidatus Viridilinea mediisalina]|uniref:C-20 methyltransferase BchU n=1 Tax=Candidatus Viridilinea mediisalina TaxID=2024553 RepID=A0A2A6RMN0_9CHLR|nr:C-20 methyltransferase BchU [Candidatus Viridilinea mediisalina]PDW04110.1 C-20 methyltransferase BchU [Candidatus Viridilinea mediisalina]
MTTEQAQFRCNPNCRCMEDDAELYRATERAYEMVFKGTVDFFVIKAAYDLGLFEAMASGPRALNDLAETTGSVPIRLERLLITMEKVGLAQPVEGAWALTPFAEQFFTAPDEHRNMTMLPFVSYMVDLIQSFYANLADVTRGKMDFTSHVPHPPRTREDSIFYETIHRSNIHFVLKLLRDHADLSGVKQLIDVGGGIGDIAASLCQKYPDLNVKLINLPSALDLVRENAAEKGLEGRLEPVAVDMYREPYPQGDAVMFARILYPMNRQFCTMMLQKAHAALEPGGKVMIIDMVISDKDKPNYDYLTHYVCGIGMNFSVLEFKDHALYKELLQELGFRDITVTEGYDHVLYQAVKA